MRAISYSAFGPAADVLSLSDIKTPSPAAGEVLVRLVTSGVNPSDVKSRAGGRPGVPRPAFAQIIPHSDGAGVIEAVGDGVSASRVGERVWIWNGQWQRAFGTAAEYIALPADQAVCMPDAVSFEAGATLGIPALTAAQCVFGGGEIAGKSLLVSGGGGSVGHMAVQMAKDAGAYVIATASATTRADAQAAGADHVLDYSADDLSEQIIAANNGKLIDRAVETEFGPNINLLAEVMAPLSTIAAYGSQLDMAPTLPFGPMLFKALKIDITLIYLLPKAERDLCISRVHAALEKGALVPRIHATFPLEDCAKAHAAVEAGKRNGSVLLTIN